MELRLRPLICSIVYISLVIITLQVLLSGPLKFCIGEVGTHFIESLENVNDLNTNIKWPDVSVCMSPKDKDKTKLNQFLQKGFTRSFSNESEYYELSEDTFFTKPHEMIYALGRALVRFVKFELVEFQ